MTTDKLKVVLGNYKWSLLVGALMLVMTGFGYKLARYIDKGHAVTLEAQRKTIDLLVEENNDLTTKVNQLDIALELAKQEKVAFAQALKDAHNETYALQEKVAFYERVMAPEKTQDGFVIEGIEVLPMPQTNEYQLRLVVLQQRQNKSILNGKIAVTVHGTYNGKVSEISMGDAGFIEEPLHYRFKYFQAINVMFKLPDTFIPSSISLDTTVYQYKTRKGDFSKSVLWEKVLNTELVSDVATELSLL